MPVEHLDELGEVAECARQAIDLVDDDQVDRSTINGCEQLLQCRALQGAAGVAAIVVAVGNELPSFKALTLDVGGTGFAPATGPANANTPRPTCARVSARYTRALSVNVAK